MNGNFFTFWDGLAPAPHSWSRLSGLWRLRQGTFQLGEHQCWHETHYLEVPSTFWIAKLQHPCTIASVD